MAGTAEREIARLRLVAQRLCGHGHETAADAVRWLTALQGQDYPGALTSVALRTEDGSRAKVEEAMNAGEVVRSWPMRGTLHLVAAEDLPWLLQVTATRAVAGAAGRRAQLDLDEATLENARTVAVRVLSGGRQLRRAELQAAWEDAGVSVAGQRGNHLIRHLAQTGTLCFGPVAGGEQRIVLLDEWIPRGRQLERPEALGELALRFFRSHGPATHKDLARWTGLTITDVRTGVAAARPELATLELDGAEYLMDPSTPELLELYRERVAGVHLLPGFDEFILGYQDRRAAVPAEFADHIVPGGNGVFRPTVVSDGRVVGTWKHSGTGAKRTVRATPFTTFPAEVSDAIPGVYAALP
ncbi:winged helix DNA-binding domain-containing protein [Haloechinothrix sp. YIM 98757]|uniref:Winged helix DNA-binding domain-containing protein n=1 Tax=Haloechinothrix aidingensis TaxID=2752311 RepID=A0A838AE87_9PSEU|nr:winged helix DNA-binding domain-containing protein [Haloechinothrix aidingensis]MBA0127438.1 winged helix DNA-binding domain-containing protein [Haloechinothrix aidingensis]